MAYRVLAFLHRLHLVAVGLALLALVVLVGAVNVVTKDRTVPTTVVVQAGPSESGSPVPGASPTADASPPPVPGVVAADPTPMVRQVKSVFFGDAIVAGANAGDGSQTFVDVASRLLGWGHSDYGFPGSGFTTAGSYKGGRDYLARIQQLRGYNIDVLVIEGGANDGAADPKVLQSKVQAVVDAARTLVPAATIVLMGPWSSSDTPTPAAAATNEVLRAFAAEAKLPYIDPINEKWISGSYPGSGNAADYISVDGYFPNAKGHEFFGQRVAEDLKHLLPAHLLRQATSG